MKRYTIQSIGRYLERLDKSVGELHQSVAILTETVGQVLIEQTIMKEDIAGLKADVAGLKSDVAGLKSDVAGLKADVNELRNDMGAVKSHLYRHDKRFDEQDERLDRHEFWLKNISEDIRVVMPDHEVRIVKLEKAVAA